MGASKSGVVLVSFNAGVINPRLESRADLQRASQSCRELKNFRVELHGRATRRAGTQFIAAVKIP